MRPGLGLKRLVRHLVNLGFPARESMQRWRWRPGCTDFLLLCLGRVVLSDWCAPSDALPTRRIDLGIIVDGFVAAVGAVTTHALRGGCRGCGCARNTAGEHHEVLHRGGKLFGEQAVGKGVFVGWVLFLLKELLPKIFDDAMREKIVD